MTDILRNNLRVAKDRTTEAAHRVASLYTQQTAERAYAAILALYDVALAAAPTVLHGGWECPLCTGDENTGHNPPSSNLRGPCPIPKLEAAFATLSGAEQSS